jgi:hypothetical protein
MVSTGARGGVRSKGPKKTKDSRRDVLGSEQRPYWHVLVIGCVLVIWGAIGSQLAVDQPFDWGAVPEAALAWLWLPILLLVAAAISRRPAPHAWLDVLINPAAGEEPAFSQRQRLFWPAAGFGAVLTALLLLELAYPYYFTQNDNLAQNLPSILWGCHNLFHGVLPMWNPFQYSGSPLTTVGWYALTYPFTYLSYGFAKVVLRNENALLDVFAFAHLLAGYLVLYWAIRRERCRPVIAAMAAGCCMLSGYALIFSRSWFQFSPVLFWTVLMIVCIQELPRRRVGWRWILAYGATLGVFFHAGHVQMWTYSILLLDFALLLFLLCGACSRRNLPAVLAAHFAGLAIAAPLLVPQALATYGGLRQLDSSGIWSGLKGLFLPDSLSPSPHPLRWGPGYPIGEMYYSGTLFMVLAVVLLLSLLVLRWRKSLIAANVWFLCALLALILALGNRGMLWTAISYLPGFDRFRYPFKFLGYLVVFTSIGGAIALERLLRSRPKLARFELVLAGVVWALLAYHCTLCTAAFYNFDFQPFPSPDPRILARLKPDGDRYYPRVLPVLALGDGHARGITQIITVSRDPHMIDSYMNQWSTLQRTFSLGGYDGLAYKSPPVQRMVQGFQDNWQQTLFEHGVKYILQYDPPDWERGRVRVPWPGSTLVYESGTVFLNELPSARPMAFAAAAPDRALPVQFDAAGATIDVSEVPRGGSVVLNMLWRSEIKARANGASLPTMADDWDRILVNVPPGSSPVRISFRPPWGLGFLAAGVLGACGAVLAAYARRLNQLGDANVARHTDGH